MQGAGGIAFDGDGLMYVDDTHPARIVTLDPRTGEQRDYTSFRAVSQCAAQPDGECTLGDRKLGPLPGAMVFLPDGSMLVTDLQQALIWKVPRGGGRPTVWFTDGRLASDFGLNKIVWAPDRRTLILSDSLSDTPGLITPGAGAILKLPINRDASAGQISEVWESAVGESPDGVAVATSGNLYVSTSNGNQMLKITLHGQVVARAPSATDNAQRQIQVDGPSSVVFFGRRLLVANQSFLTGNTANWALLDVWSGETGVQLYYPHFKQPAACAGTRVIRVAVGRKRIDSISVTAAGHTLPARLRHGVVSFRLPRRWRGRLRVTLVVAGPHYRRVLHRAFGPCPPHISTGAWYGRPTTRMPLREGGGGGDASWQRRGAVT
jgi:sugar lactone lactonase YvrE